VFVAWPLAALAKDKWEMTPLHLGGVWILEHPEAKTVLEKVATATWTDVIAAAEPDAEATAVTTAAEDSNGR